MNNNEIVLLSLIQRALFNNNAIIPAGVDWKAVLLEAQQQAVVAIAASGLPADLPQNAREEWWAAEYRQLAYGRWYRVPLSCRWDAEGRNGVHGTAHG